jgi:2-polyprenyl-3-methyl-5-hydroxy-6-metoxy-1,4-benzoquinol methylase
MNCYHCNHPLTKIICPTEQLRFRGFGHKKSFFQCSNCALVQLSPPWAPLEEESLHEKFSAIKDFPGQHFEQKPYSNFSFVKPSDSVLELGCGNGTNIKKIGGEIEGCDLDEMAVRSSGLSNIYNLSADWMMASNQEKYDLVFGIHVFEHFQDPRTTLSCLAAALKPGGRFFFEMPNVEDPLLIGMIFTLFATVPKLSPICFPNFPLNSQWCGSRGIILLIT